MDVVDDDVDDDDDGDGVDDDDDVDDGELSDGHRPAHRSLRVLPSAL